MKFAEIRDFVLVSLYILYLCRMEQKEIKALAEAKRREKAEARAAKYVIFDGVLNVPLIW